MIRGAKTLSMALMLALLGCTARTPAQGPTHGPPEPTPVEVRPAEPYSIRGLVRGSGPSDRLPAPPEAAVVAALMTRAPDGGWWHVPDEKDLHTNEGVLVEVDLRVAGHVYLLHVFEGEPELLYPLARLGDQDRLWPTGLWQFPPPDAKDPLLILDDQIGREILLVIVAKRPLLADESLAAIGREVQKKRRAGRPATKPRPAEPRAEPMEVAAAAGEGRAMVTPTYRSDATIDRDRGLLSALLQDDEIAVLPLVFDHVP